MDLPSTNQKSMGWVPSPQLWFIPPQVWGI